MRCLLRTLRAGWAVAFALFLLLAPGARAARPLAPPPVGGSLRIASANVDNFFSTIADGAHACAPGGTPADCRGARSAAAFERQRAALAAEIAGLDADVVGLMEIENDGAVTLGALLRALDARVGAGTYTAVDDPREGTGSDAIKVALVYRPARVRPVGPSHADPSSVHNRAPLAQTFEVVSTASPAAGPASRFNVIVSHFKAKPCGNDAHRPLASSPDRDLGALQGCWNARRVAQARALRTFAADVERRSGVRATLLVGDFNADGREDPVLLLERAGFVDLLDRFDPAAYTFVHDGVARRIDQALASPALAAHVTGAAAWHINADQPPGRGTAGGHEPSCAVVACPGDARTALPYRASDHDPLVVGLRFGS